MFIIYGLERNMLLENKLVGKILGLRIKIMDT